MSENYKYSEFDFQKAELNGKSAYLLLGEDLHLQEKGQFAIRSRLLKNSDTELVLIYGNEVSRSVLSDLLDAYSIFSASKLIVIRNAEAMRVELLEIIASYLDTPADDQILIICSTKADVRYGAWKKIKTKALCIACDPPKYIGELTPCLETELRRRGISMAPDARAYFLNNVELSYSALDSEIEKLALLLGKRNRITLADVELCMGNSRAGTLADYYRALGKQDLKEVLQMSYSLMQADWEFLQLLFQLQRFYLLIWKIRLLMDAHISESEISSKHLQEIFPTYRKDYLDAAKRYKKSHIERAFAHLLEADSQKKLSLASDELILCNTLVQILKPTLQKRQLI